MGKELAQNPGESQGANGEAMGDLFGGGSMDEQHLDDSQAQDGEGASEEGSADEQEPQAADPQAQIRALEMQLAEMKGMLLAGQQKLQQPAEGQVKEEGEKKPASLVSAEELESILEKGDATAFNQVLIRSAQAGAQLGAKLIMQQLPEIIQRTVNQTTNEQQAVQGFYQKNPDLVPMAKYVALHAQELAQSNPSLTQQQLFDKLGPSFRKVFKMEQARGGQAARPAGQPSPAGGRSGGPAKRPGGAAAPADEQRAFIDQLFEASGE